MSAYLPRFSAARAGRNLISVAPGFFAGMLASLGLSPFGYWPISLVAFALVLWFVAEAPAGAAAFRRALACGMGYFALALNWIVDPFLVQPEIFGWMAPFALLLMALGGGMFWAIPGWVAWHAGRGVSLRALGFAACLVLSDWLRGWIFTGFPWALNGQIWVETPIAQLAAYCGALGLSSVTVVAAVLPVALGPTRRGIITGTIASALFLAACWGLGSWRMAAPLPPDLARTVRLVQPDAVQARKWDPQWAGVFYGRMLDLTAAPGRDGRRPDLVIWPETAVNFLLEQPGDELLRIAQAAQGARVVIGVQSGRNGEYFNSLAEITPAGQTGAIYDKFHLVPFGEYLPWGKQLRRFGINAFAAQLGSGFTPGAGPRVLQLGDLPPVQPLICYEVIFPDHLRGDDERPGWLLQATNDAWFGTWTGPWQHLAQARLRAIESGLPLLRVANTGVSAVIDARGRVRQQLGLGTVGLIDTALPAALPPTPFIRWGDWWVPLDAALAVLLVAVAARRRTPRKSGGL
ncbi:apolipoprotein N-acyltransferase [Paracoccus pacificus]|uniref:Apolipoprotein N-acyltransferase n=1 Tax=Paracoccus pacificus TaxID=1463598 RepID=A0ABW4R6X7_9RHOB